MIPEEYSKYLVLIGLENFDKRLPTIWTHMLVHLVIFVFTTIQYHLLNLEDFAGIIVNSSTC